MIYQRLAMSITALMGLLFCHNISASETDDWRFEVTPYFLAAGMEGEVGIGGRTADIDMSFDDILDSLDAGFMGLFSAQKGPWTLGFETVYFKLSDDASVTGPLGRVDAAIDLTTEMSIFSGTVAYRIVDEKTKLDVLGALRYTDLEADASVLINSAGPVAFSTSLDAGGSKDWTDVVLGLKVTHPVASDVDLVGYVDVGGNDDSETWQAIAGVNWHFKEDYTAKFGYRVLDWDYDDGSFKWDMQSAGIYAGLGIAF